MPSNTSASGGYLVPSSVAPSYDDAFDDFLHDLVAGVTGINRTLVRPRWQVTPPKQPEPNINWCAIGVMSAAPLSVLGQIVHDPDGTIIAPGDGSDGSTTWERVVTLASLYGPNAWGNAGFLNDGLHISQNREAMTLAGVGLFEIGTRRQMSELAAQQVFIRRVDIEICFTRRVQRVYPIYNLLQAQGTVVRRSDGTGLNVTEQWKTKV